MKISVVTTVLNEAASLPRLLDSLVGQEGPFEVIIVDAGSTDSTLPLARLHGDRLDLKILEKPGCTRGDGLNTGARAATGDAIAFIGGDDWADKGWLAAIRKGLRDHDVVVGHNEIHGDSRFNLERVHLTVDGQDVSHSGCNTTYKKEAFLKVGGLDADFVTAEDIDLNFRAVKAGYRIGVVPEARVYRTLRTTPRKFLKQAFWNGYGRKQLTRKHGDLWRGYSLKRLLRSHAGSGWGMLRIASGGAGYLWAEVHAPRGKS
jgi:glycosyltransferase involved in cell wall biosynthesis